MENAIKMQSFKGYGQNAAKSFVINALIALKEGRWNQLLEAPSKHGIPKELVDLLKKYKEDHPILLTAANRPKLVKEILSIRQKGECFSGLYPYSTRMAPRL